MRSNPFSQIMSMMNQNKNMINPMMNPIGSFMNGNKKQPIDKNQFKQFIPNLNDNIIQQLAVQAKNQGMSDEEIANGINFIMKFK